MDVTLPACQCGEKSFSVDEYDLIDAGGWIECDKCARPLVPDENSLQVAAITAAMDAMKGERMAWGPGAWLAEIRARVSAIRAEWLKNLESANAR